MWRKIMALGEEVRISPREKEKNDCTLLLLRVALVLVVVLALTAGYLAVKLEKNEEKLEELEQEILGRKEG